MDVFSTEERSALMSKIRSKNTGPEILVRKFLFSNGIRFRLHNAKLPGRPDLVLKKYNTAIFVNGCFWHGHENCKYFKLPKARRKYWKNKIDNNRIRDHQAKNNLEQLGWSVIVIWECQLKPNIVNYTLQDLLSKITPS
ncbi:very short patch repair endonuclease [Bacteroidota bacterium]